MRSPHLMMPLVLVLAVFATPLAGHAVCEVVTKTVLGPQGAPLPVRTVVCDEPEIPTSIELEAMKQGCRQETSDHFRRACEEGLEEVVSARRTAWLETRLKQGLSLEDAAAKLGVSVPEVERLAASLEAKAPPSPRASTAEPSAEREAELQALREELARIRTERGL